jgi:hypothetical protein
MSDDRPNVYQEGDLWVYRASSLGSCTRSLLFARKGMEPLPPPSWLQEKFDQGNAMEDTLMAQFASDNSVTVDGEQLEVELRTSPTTLVRGHIDGMTRMNDKRVVVDAKFLGKSLWTDLRAKGVTAFPHYAWQTSVYCHALEADEWCLAMGLKDEQGTWTGEMHYLFGTPTFSRDDIVARISEIEAYVDSEILPACPTPPDYPCPFYYLHDDEEEVVELTGVDSDRMYQAWDCYQQAKELEAKAKRIKDDGYRAAKQLFEKHGPRLKSSKISMTWVPDSDVPEQTVTRKGYTKKGYPRWKSTD